MNIDELINSISENDKKIQLLRWVDEWKENYSDVEDLANLISKWLGNVWFNDQEAHNDFYNAFSNFRENVINNIGGMTVNERLYYFGLIAQWDKADNESRKRIRVKINADA